MRSEAEIRERIAGLERKIQHVFMNPAGISDANGQIEALEWVLEEHVPTLAERIMKAR